PPGRRLPPTSGAQDRRCPSTSPPFCPLHGGINVPPPGTLPRMADVRRLLRCCSRDLRRGGEGGRLGETLANPRSGRAFVGDGPHFNLGSVSETGTLLRDGGGFLEAVRGNQEIATDGFLRFGKRAVRDQLATVARDHASLADERLAALHPALFRQL